MKFRILGVFLPALLLLLSACSPRYTFKIDAISDGSIAGNESFYLISGNPDMKASDLRFREAAEYVATGLEGKGYTRARDIGSADMLVEVSFGVGEPREVLDVRNYPETYWSPGMAFRISVPVYDSNGAIVAYQHRSVYRPPRSYTYWEERVDSTTVFSKELTLTAYDNRLGSSVEEPRQLWSVTVGNIDHSDNLRAYLPYMIAASLPYIGEDTGSQVFMYLEEDDPQTEFIRNPDGIPTGS
jgi:hypothetical protein